MWLDRWAHKVLCDARKMVIVGRLPRAFSVDSSPESGSDGVGDGVNGGRS